MQSFEMTSSAFKGAFQTNVSPARLIVTTTGATPTREDERPFIEFMTRVVQSQIEFIATYDLRVVGTPSPSLLRSLGEWLKKNRKEFEDMNTAIAIILQNNMWSGVVKKLIGVVTAICPPVCPLQITYSLESVESFFSEQCGIIEIAPIPKMVSRLTSLDSCEVICEEDEEEPTHSQVPRRMNIAIRPGMDRPSERDDISPCTKSFSLFDYAECSIDASVQRGCVTESLRSFGKVDSESNFRPMRSSPKNMNRVRPFVTKPRWPAETFVV
jgi:hypothetical protein